MTAFNQNEVYKNDNDSFIQEQKDLAWKKNLNELYLSFNQNLSSLGVKIEKYTPLEIETAFLLKQNKNNSYDYDLLISTFETDLVHFLAFLRISEIYNEITVDIYDNLCLFYYYLGAQLSYYESVSKGTILFDTKKSKSYVKKVTVYFNKICDLVYTFNIR